MNSAYNHFTVLDLPDLGILDLDESWSCWILVGPPAAEKTPHHDLTCALHYLHFPNTSFRSRPHLIFAVMFGSPVTSCVQLPLICLKPLLWRNMGTLSVVVFQLTVSQSPSVSLIGQRNLYFHGDHTKMFFLFFFTFGQYSTLRLLDSNLFTPVSFKFLCHTWGKSSV